MGRFYDFKKFRFLPFYRRVGNIKVSNYWSREDEQVVPFYFEGVPFAAFSIVQLYPNDLYGRESEYKLDESGFYRSSSEFGTRISPEVFKSRECSAILGEFVELNNDELAFSLKLNDRIFELSNEEKLILFDLATEAHRFICEQLNYNIKEDDYDE